MTNLDWALACAARGWLVFPSEAKRPLIRWSVGSTTDPDAITDMWTRWPDADVCIKTGADSNLVVIDWDAYKITSPLKQNPLGDLLPDTYTVATSKGGYHYYFTHPGYPVSNSASNLAEYIDVRGDGGMVVAYRDVVRLREPVRIPDSLCQRRTTPSANPTVSLTPPPFAPRKGAERRAQDLMLVRLAEITQAPQGKRNLTLYTKASDILRQVWYGQLDMEPTLQVLGDTALAIGLEPHEIAATLQSAVRNAASQVERERTAAC